MNTWTSLAPSDLTHYLYPSQLDALRQIDNTEGTSTKDPLPSIITDITAKIRTEIAAFPKNFLPADPTILPPSLKSIGCFLVIEALQSRIPTLKLTPDQIRNADNARVDLRRVAKGELPITLPLTTPSPPSLVDAISSRKLQATANTLQGL